MSFGSNEVFYFHPNSNWISFRLVEGLSTVCHLVGAKNGILPQSSLFFVSAFWSPFLAFSVSKTISICAVYFQAFANEIRLFYVFCH